MGSHRHGHGRYSPHNIQQVNQPAIITNTISITTHALFLRPVLSDGDNPASTFPADLPNSSTDFYEVMDMLDKRLNDKGKNWRHVLKSLKVLDYCLHEGSELVVTWARKNIYIIKTLREFIYLDEDGRDVGASSKHKRYSQDMEWDADCNLLQSAIPPKNSPP